MTDAFRECLEITLEFEGGWSDHPHDPGGATMKGVTLATYRAYRPGATKQDLRNITDDEVAAIYRKGYWNAANCDRLAPGQQLVAFDGAVNSGVKRGVGWLQRALGVATDGAAGPATQAASLAAARDKRGAAVVTAACGYRLGFMQSLRIWSTFGRGWARRVARVEAVGVRQATLAHQPGARAVLVARQVGAKANADAAGATGATSPVAAGGASVLADLPSWGIAALLVVGVLFAVVMFSRRRVEQVRAEEFERAALEVRQ